MILIQRDLCGISLKKKWEFGDRSRAEMWVLNFLLFKVYFIKHTSDFNSFLRGYTDQNFDWHPQVRLARNKAARKAERENYKSYMARTKEWMDRCSELSNTNSGLRNDIISLKRTIKLIKEE
jgi:hypothetical protein